MMGRTGKMDISGLRELQENLQNLQSPDAFVEACARELAARLLAKARERTPVGNYGKSYVTDADGNRVRYKAGRNRGKVRRATVKTGGTLRRGWTIGKIRKDRGVYRIDIINPVEYASYVEYGHRTANHRGWVRGHFMMTISERELERTTPKILENKIKQYLEGYLR